MVEKILLGRGQSILEAPEADWKMHLAGRRSFFNRVPHPYLLGDAAQLFSSECCR